jgi:hypothetical protein
MKGKIRGKITDDGRGRRARRIKTIWEMDS